MAGSLLLLDCHDLVDTARMAAALERALDERADNLACRAEAEYAAAHPDAASRPAWSALENRMLACTVGNEMRPWQEALTEFFKNESPEA